MSYKLTFDKFEVADFKYDNSSLKKTISQKYPNKAFFVSNLNIFILSQNFAIRQIRGR